LNNKRTFITDMEGRYGVPITVQASDRMQGGNFAIERSAAPLPPQRLPERSAVNMDWGFEGDGVEEEERPDFAPQPEGEGEGRRAAAPPRPGRPRWPREGARQLGAPRAGR